MGNFARLNERVQNVMEEASDEDKRRELEKLQSGMDALKEKLVALGTIDPSQDLAELQQTFVDSVEKPFSANRKWFSEEFNFEIVGFFQFFSQFFFWSEHEEGGGHSSFVQGRSEVVTLSLPYISRLAETMGLADHGVRGEIPCEFSSRSSGRFGTVEDRRLRGGLRWSDEAVSNVLWGFHESCVVRYCRSQRPVRDL